MGQVKQRSGLAAGAAAVSAFAPAGAGAKDDLTTVPAA
jgi:hypothetical protein